MTLGHLDIGQDNAQVHAVDQVTVAADYAGHLATPVSSTVEGLLDALHSIVGVAAVHCLEESDLRVTSQVNILCAISDKLHKSAAHFVCMLLVLV